MGRRPVWKAARQNRAAAGKTVCKCGGPPKNIILQTRAAWPGKDALVMQKFDAVLFDLDGTLIDSAPGILATFQKTFEAFGLAVGEQRLRPFLGPPLRSSMAQLLPEAQVEQAVETGAVPVTLGKRILRTETAGMTVLSMLMYLTEED